MRKYKKSAPSKNFREKIVKRYGSDSELAKRLGWSRQRLSKVLQGKQELTLENVNELSTAMDMPIQEVANEFTRPVGSEINRERRSEKGA